MKINAIVLKKRLKTNKKKQFVLKIQNKLKINAIVNDYSLQNITMFFNFYNTYIRTVNYSVVVT